MSAILLPTAPAGMTPAVTPPPAGAWPRRWKFTREQFYKLGELGYFQNRRVQLVFGDIIEMEPMKWPHARALGLTGIVLRQVFAAGFWVSEQKPFAALDSLPMPDFAAYAGSIDDYTDHPTAALLLVEVADTSLNFDTTTKAELYATAGVPEYWVLDLTARELIVFRDPAPLPAGLGATAYRTRTAHAPGETVSPLAAPTAAVAIADLLP